MVVTRDPVSDYSLDLLTTITKEPPPQVAPLAVTRDEEGWHAEAKDLVAV
jgi:hypothetical protein